MPPPPELGNLVPYLHYDDAAAMIEWYERVFGFTEGRRWLDDDGRVENADMVVGDTELWMDGGGRAMHDAAGNPSAWIGVWVDDVDAMYEPMVSSAVHRPSRRSLRMLWE